MVKGFLFCSALALSSVAQAEDPADNFVGPLIGVEAGLVQHLFEVTVTQPGRPDQINNIKSSDVGGVGFVGYDFKVGSNLIVGAEAALHAGGKTTSFIAIPNTFTQISIDPKLGYSVTGRLGYAPSDNVLLFGRAGYGSHRYGIVGVGNVRTTDTNNSFVLGAGAEYRVSGKITARLDLRHLDASRNEILVGILTRF